MGRTITEWVLKLVDDISSPMRSAHRVAEDTADAVEDVQENLDDAGKSASRLPGIFDNIGAKAFMFNELSDAIGKVNEEFKSVVSPGNDFEMSMAEMSAITGMTGDGLDSLGDKARTLAEDFGVSASGSVESFKLLLSQLSPDLANNSEALDLMTRNVMTLSKTMGGDTTSAAEVLTTALNQYGISMEDPMAAAEEMTRMMNIMAAAAREGSAELPAQKEALEQAGMSAKAAGVSFEETASAIQVLDKAGKKGSEGGVALRNIMTTLSQGRFLPEDVRQELEAAGISVDALSDKSRTFSQRLALLRPIMQDDALLTKLFGRESQAAALALLEGIPQMDRWTEAIQGTNTAFDQASVIMDTNIEKQARMGAWIENVKIGFANAISPVIPFVSVTGDAITQVANFGFALQGLGIIFKRNLYTGIWSGIRGIGSFIAASKAGTAISAVFAGATSISFATFKTAAVSACRAVGAAIMSIPIVGWIAAIITGLIALGTYFYKTSASFRGFLWGTWDAIKAVFSGIGDYIGNVLEGIWHLLKGVFNPANWFDDNYSFEDGIRKLLDADRDFGEKVGAAFQEGRAAGMADFADEKAENAAEETGFRITAPTTPDPDEDGPSPGMALPPLPSSSRPGQIPVAGVKEGNVTLSGIGNTASGGGRNITMNVTFNQSFASSGDADIRVVADKVMAVITGVLRDATVAVG